jgi:ferric-dicitrate binding protein FerR (iron transport regulator)
MRLEVTREVVSDLWPLYSSGEASQESRALVDAFLASDKGFASTLQRSEGRKLALPDLRLSPDAERRLLDDAARRARQQLLFRGAVLAVVAIIAAVALGGVLLLTFRGHA